VLVFNEITKMPNPYDPIVVGQQGERRRAMLFAGVRVMEWESWDTALYTWQSTVILGPFEFAILKCAI